MIMRMIDGYLGCSGYSVVHQTPQRPLEGQGDDVAGPEVALDAEDHGGAPLGDVPLFWSRSPMVICHHHHAPPLPIYLTCPQLLNDQVQMDGIPLCSVGMDVGSEGTGDPCVVDGVTGRSSQDGLVSAALIIPSPALALKPTSSRARPFAPRSSHSGWNPSMKSITCAHIVCLSHFTTSYSTHLLATTCLPQEASTYLYFATARARAALHTYSA